MSNIFNEVVEASQYLLLNSPDAEAHLEYLKLRVNPEMRDKFSFGYFPTTSNLSLLTSLVSSDKLKRAELVYERSAIDNRSVCSYFEYNNLILPYRDVYGDIVGLIGRTIVSEDEMRVKNIVKYKNTAFKKGNHVFGLYEAKRSILENDCVYVVEGQFDALKAHECNFQNVVAIGSSQMSDYQFALICRYTNNLFLLLDNDDAGREGSSRIVKRFSNYANIVNLKIPRGYKDLDEYLKTNSVDALSFKVCDVQYYL